METPLRFLDVNAGYGAFPNKPAEARWTLAHLLEDLDLAEIAGALTHHHQAIFSEPMSGNRRLIREIAPFRARLAPCWIALPEIAGDFPVTKDFVREMRDNDVRAVRIEVDTFDLPMTMRVWRPLADALAELNALCVLSVSYGCRDFTRVDALLEIFGNLNTVIANHGWAQWRNVCALMDAHPRLHLEFSHFQANRAVEYFSGRFGVERCLFGTGLPHRAPGAARGYFDFSLLDRKTVAKLAGENLSRLLNGWCPTEGPGASPWRDAFTADAIAGRALSPLILDAHCHIGEDGCTSLAPNIVTPHGDAAGMIELTRRIGINRTAVMSWVGPLSMDSALGNQIVAEAVRRYPDELIGVPTINPEYDSPDAIEAIIRRYHIELGFPGIKTFTPCQCINYDDPTLARWLEYANEHHLYMVFDPKGGVAATDVLANVASRYPQLRIHLDHCGQSWEYAKWAVRMMRRFPNIFAQLNYTMVTNGVIEYLAQEVTAERLLFGTDAPMRDPRPQVAWLVFTRLNEMQKRLIFGENFHRQLEECYPNGRNE